MLLRRALLRELARGKWSLLAAFVGLSIAVASIAAIHLLNSRVAFNLEQIEPLGLPVHLARRQDGRVIAIADYADLVNRHARGQIPGIDSIAPLIDGVLDDGWRILGVDWVALRNSTRAGVSSNIRTEDEFSRLLTRQSVLVPTSLKLEGVLQLGDHAVQVLGRHRLRDESLLIADIATASELLGQEDISALALIETPKRLGILELLDHLFVGIAALHSRRLNQEILGSGYVISAPDEELPVRRFASAVMFNLGVLSLLCLLVAGFIAFQSSVGTAQRRAPLMQRLSSMGAQSVRLARLVYSESAMLGLAACLVGVPLGYAIANLAFQFGGMEAQKHIHVDYWLIAKALGIGVGVSLGGTFLARSRAQGDARESRGGWLTYLFAPLLICAGLFTGLPGAFLILGGIFILIVQIAWLKFRCISGMRLNDIGVRGRHILRGAASQGEKLFPVVSAFILALSVALAMQLMVSSLKQDFELFLDQRLDGHLTVQGSTGGLTEAQISRLAGFPEVVSMRLVETASAMVGPLQVATRIIEYSNAELARYGAPADISEDEALVNGQLAQRIDTAPMLRVSGDRDKANLIVGHEFNDFGAAQPRMILSKQIAAQLFEHSRFEALRLEVEPGTADVVRSRIEQELGLSVGSTSELRKSAQKALDDTFWVSDVLSMVALLVAVFGIVTGFNQLYLARLREFRLLRGLGLSSREMLALVVAESGMMALLALPFALTLSLIMSWLLCQQINPLAFGFSINLAVDWRLVIVFAVIGVVVAPLASLLPWRMVREASHVATADESF